MKKITLKIDDREIEAEIKDRDYKELAKPKKKELWVPNYKGEYWYVGDDSYIYEGRWDGGHIDDFRLCQNNVFRTREEAEKEWDRLEALVSIRKYIHENDMYFEPDWSNPDQNKFYTYYNHEEKEFDLDIRNTRDYGSVLPPVSSVDHWLVLTKDCEEDLEIVFGIEH